MKCILISEIKLAFFNDLIICKTIKFFQYKSTDSCVLIKIQGNQKEKSADKYLEQMTLVHLTK